MIVCGVPCWLGHVRGYSHRPKSVRISLLRPEKVRACLLRQNALAQVGKRRGREKKTKECVLKGGRHSDWKLKTPVFSIYEISPSAKWCDF